MAGSAEESVNDERQAVSTLALAAYRSPLTHLG